MSELVIVVPAFEFVDGLLVERVFYECYFCGNRVPEWEWNREYRACEECVGDEDY